MRLRACRAEKGRRPGEAGLTLMELIIVVTMLSILAMAAIPVARFQVKRTKERELRRDLWAMRDAIDKYKGRCRQGADPDQGGQQQLPAGPADAGRRSDGGDQADAVSAGNSDRPDDQEHGLGPALEPG